MKLKKTTVHLYTFAVVIVFANAKYIVQQDSKNNSTKNGTIVDTPLAVPKQDIVVHHIRREKREMTPDLPFDFFTMHYPCSLDIYIHPPVKDVGSYYHWLPPHCVIIYNNRFAHEGYYRVYNLYRMEGFTFGMYYERIKRYETEAYVFDYTNIRLE